MAGSRLSRAGLKLLEQRVDDVFDRLLLRLLGHAFTGKHLYFEAGHHPDMSLPGIFHNAVNQEGGYVDRDLLHGIAEVVKDYLDKHRAEAKGMTKARLQAILHDMDAGRFKAEDFRTAFEGEMSRLWDRVRTNVEKVVNTETQHAATMGTKSAIDQIHTNLGLEEPMVVFVPVNDSDLCDECRRIHLMPDGKTPRVWPSSEVSSDYHKKGDDTPSWHLMHPHCRCSLASVLPGFGFNAAGRVTYVREGWSEYEYQQAMMGENLGGVQERRAWKVEVAKSEPAASLVKARQKPLPSEKALQPFCDDKECYVRAEEVSQKYPHLAWKTGFFVRPNGRAGDHAWTQAADGTIVDTTYSQFDRKVKLGIFRPGSPEHARYRSYDEHHAPHCLLQALGVDEPCQVPGCSWKGRRRVVKFDVSAVMERHKLRKAKWEAVCKRPEPTKPPARAASSRRART